LPLSAILSRIDDAIAGKRFDRVLFITNRIMANKRFTERYAMIASFDETIEVNESLYVYQLKASADQRGRSTASKTEIDCCRLFSSVQ
jgi:hypothetical protein